MAWEDWMKDFHARRAKARGMGGPERLARRRAGGALNARERVDRELDPQARTRTAIGRHRLAGWPTTF